MVYCFFYLFFILLYIKFYMLNEEITPNNLINYLNQQEDIK